MTDPYQAPDSAKKHQSFEENMKRLHAEIERMVYSAEIACPKIAGPFKAIYECRDENCAFRQRYCTLVCLRSDIGDHPEQHDPTEEVK